MDKINFWLRFWVDSRGFWLCFGCDLGFWYCVAYCVFEQGHAAVMVVSQAE